MFAIEVIAEELREVSRALDFATFDGRDAARLTEVAAEVERLGAAIKLGYAKRAVDTTGWYHSSRATSSEQWLAGASGCSEHQAKEVLATARRLDELPATERHLRDGLLSMAQASLVSKAAEVAPDAEAKLLRSAERDGLRELRDRSDRVIAAHTDEGAAHAKAKRERHLRTWRDGMATGGSFSGPTEEVDAILRALEPLSEQRFEEARKADEREPYDAYRFDALVALATDARTEAGPPVTRIRIDLDRLLDAPDGDAPDGDAPNGDAPNGDAPNGDAEVCEIPGVGPVPVAHARKVLPHGLMELVITDGVDVRIVVTRTRHVPEPLKLAISERDQRCKVVGCDRTHRLERHHTERFSENRRTAYDVLGNLCGDHHDLVTYHGSEIVDRGDGTWSLRPPEQGRDTDAA